MAACQRIITILSDRTNQTAIRAELALATPYYVRAGKEYRPEPVELPENKNIYRHPHDFKKPVWDHVSIREFPFVTACLLQGVAFDPFGERCYPAIPEPLGTVYHDTSLEWSMVVVNITELHEIRYGIAAFAAATMKWANSLAAVRNQMYGGPLGALESGGEFRVLNEQRHHVVMSAEEYLTRSPIKVNHSTLFLTTS